MRYDIHKPTVQALWLAMLLVSVDAVARSYKKRLA